ncbi:gamma-glutamyltransferase [Oceanobacillus luteolus]|uniref:Glutathione hydrolase proenzyme n=1 Tax=Oceanobacillus luteolus TaxID=1274358 RepID=A0ABW4HT71_9BACI|nr:gamma-glutamyltransferase [Oceanobacillus luteolus]MCM3742374.1 gamma-glutamyltransferase [Oceanobacillus luteolus]
MSLEEIFQNQKPVEDAANEHTVIGKDGMVSCPVKEAAEVGEEVLKEGGNAMDAVIAMQLALAAVEGMNTGVGGGGVILYYDSSNKETKIINGHSQAPSAVKPDLFFDEEDSLISFDERSTSPRAVAVPGVLRMLELAKNQYGTLSLERLIDPAIHLAEEGFRINRSWERALENFQHRLGDVAKKTFVPDGKPLKQGVHFQQPDLVKTLKLIRKEGFSTFYEGEIADAIIKTLADHGGIMEKADLESYQSAIEEPFWGSYKDYKLAIPAPAGGGGVSLSMLLKMLEKLNVSQYDIHSWEKYHLIAEATRLVLADQQTYLGDPEFSRIPYQGLLSDEYIEERLKLIDLESKKKEITAGKPWNYQEGEPNYKVEMDHNRHGMDTTHFTAVDQWGNVAACTTSLERIFGSGIMVDGYGFMLNNDLTDFSPEPGAANEPNSKKFPVSSKSPTIVFHDGKPFFTLGSPGATTIISSVAQVLLHVLDYKMDLREAIAEVRIFNNPEASMEWEDGINEEAMAQLKKISYELNKSFKTETADNRLGDVKGILINPWNGNLYGAVDSPRPGRAIGINQNSK